VVIGAVVAAILLSGSSDEVRPTAGGGGAGRSAAESLDGSGPSPELPSVGVGSDAGSSTSAAPSGTAPAQLPGDLNVGVPISSPTCDSTWVVFLGAAIDPATYPADVSTLLASRSDAKYLLTEGGCSSMRQRTAEGTQIYAVYVGPYPDQAAACAARSAIGGNAYVKRMDNSTPPEQLWTC
jgi:serine/threonine-protein kinase